MAGSSQFTTNRKPTNLSEARVGNTTCWSSMKNLHMLHTALTGGSKISSEATVALKSDLSTQYAGRKEASAARMGSTGCWNSISQIAWEKAIATSTPTNESKHCSDTPNACKDQTEAQRRLIQYNKLKTMAENCRVCEPGHTMDDCLTRDEDTETLLSGGGEEETETVVFSEMPPSPKSLASEVSSSSSSTNSDEDSPPGGTNTNDVMGYWVLERLGSMMPTIGGTNDSTTQTNKEKSPLMDEQHLEKLKKNAMQAAGIVPQDKVNDYNHVDGKDQETMGYWVKGQSNKEVDPLDLSSRIDDMEKEMGLVSDLSNKPFGAEEYNYWREKRAPTELRMDSCFGEEDDVDDDNHDEDDVAAPVNGKRPSITMGKLNNIFGGQKKEEEKGSKTKLSGSL